MFSCHRINTLKELKEIPRTYGVEVDLRDNINGDIYLEHEPFILGELFEDYLKEYNNSFLILNIKSERIEWKILDLLKKYKIKDYFFLDSSFPMIYQLTNNNENNIAFRFSEFECLETIIKMKERINWIWIDCFNINPLTQEIYKIFKDNNLKLCFVSPELQGQPDKIELYKNYFKNNNIKLDMICTKYYNIKKWY